MNTVHFLVPDGIDDRDRPSGGNVYDRQVSRHLRSLGWTVREHAVAGPWPAREPDALAAFAAVAAEIPDGAAVLIDGLVASAAPEVLVPQASRLCLAVLVHMPLGHRPGDEDGDLTGVREREGRVLRAAAAVVTTSQWGRKLLSELYQLAPEQVRVAEPGVEAAELVAGSGSGGALLCVAAVTFEKGHDVLLDALGTMSDTPWSCVCAGSLDRAPAFASRVLQRSSELGLRDRLRFVGPRTGSDLDRSYAAADLLVLASRAETYGMVITEALSRGLPVVAADVGGVAEALGTGADGIRPGILVPPGDPAALACALRAWLRRPGLRRRLRQAASERRRSLSGWSSTASTVAEVVASASA